jgi:hypothetical protein
MNNIKNEHWIPVTTSSGMFSSECAISLELSTGQIVSFFADKGLIRENAGLSLLRVFLVNDFPEQKKQLVLLPSETFETASRWAEVATK